MERNYRIAGTEITVCVPDDVGYDDSRFLVGFRTEQVTDPHRFEFDLVDELERQETRLLTKQPEYCVYGDDSVQIRYIGTEENPYIRVAHTGKNHQVQVKKGQYIQKISAKTVLNALSMEHLAVESNGFVFHCSYIEDEGKAILFTAPSGTGKSTQADLWAGYRGAGIINGDRAVVRMENGVALACGIPFAGSSVYCENRTLPIKAVVYLAQAPQTTIRKMRGYEAFAKIWEGVSVNTWDKTDMEQVSYVVQQIVERIPIFHMPCTPDESAVMALEEALRKQESL